MLFYNHECKIYVISLENHEIPLGRGYRTPLDRGTRVPKIGVQEPSINMSHQPNLIETASRKLHQAGKQV